MPRSVSTNPLLTPLLFGYLYTVSCSLMNQELVSFLGGQPDAQLILRFGALWVLTGENLDHHSNLFKPFNSCIRLAQQTTSVTMARWSIWNISSGKTTSHLMATEIQFGE